MVFRPILQSKNPLKILRINKMCTHSVLPLAISSCQIPVINFSDKTLKPGSPKWDEVKLDVRKALEDYGCFEASFDKVSVELNKSVFEVIKELHELPIETRERNVSSYPFGGYFAGGLYQRSFGIDDPNVLDKVNDFTQQLWPGHGNKSISETIHRFSELLSVLDVMVRRMIMESFGIEKYVDEHLNSTNYMLRLIKYKVALDVDIEEANEAIGSHTDPNILSIIHQSQVDGLEVKAKDGEWIRVKASDQDSFIVMVGDSFSAIMNGRVLPTYHRVVMMKEKTRYSIGQFSFPKTGVIIDTPEELVDEEHPRLFKPFKYVEIIDFIKTEAGRRAQSTLHAFAAL